jgi:hypothetical protein
MSAKIPWAVKAVTLPGRVLMPVTAEVSELSRKHVLKHHITQTMVLYKVKSFFGFGFTLFSQTRS